MVVDAPGAVDIVVPQALEVGGHRAGTRGCDEQVAAKLEVELFELRVGQAEAIHGQAAGSVEVGAVGAAEVERDAAIKRGVVDQMARVEAGKALRSGLGDVAFHRSNRVDADIGVGIRGVGGEIHCVVGVAGHDEFNAGCVADAECLVGYAGLDPSSPGESHLHSERPLHLVAFEAAVVNEVARLRREDVTFVVRG